MVDPTTISGALHPGRPPACRLERGAVVLPLADDEAVAEVEHGDRVAALPRWVGEERLARPVGPSSGDAHHPEAGTDRPRVLRATHSLPGGRGQAAGIATLGGGLGLVRRISLARLRQVA